MAVPPQTPRRRREDNDNLEAALTYAEADWKVVPVYGLDANGGCRCSARACPAPGKHPLREADGAHHATSDPAKIRQLYARRPDAGVAVAPGASRMIVVDVHPRHGGMETLRSLLADCGVWGSTLGLETARGYAFFLRDPGDAGRLFNVQRGELGPGVSIYTHGSLVIVPPTRHHSGRAYRWHNVGEMATAPDRLVWQLSAPVPDEVEMILAESLVASEDGGRLRKWGVAALRRETVRALMVPVGERRRQISIASRRLGGIVAGGGLFADEVNEAMSIAASRRGLHVTDYARQIESAINAGLREPRFPDGWRAPQPKAPALGILLPSLQHGAASSALD